MEIVHYQTFEEIQRLVTGFQTLSLPFPSWTHEAHLTVACWYAERFGADRSLAMVRNAIQHFNLANGIFQTPTRGYHETITRCYMHLVHAFATTQPEGASELARVNALLASSYAERGYLLTHYTKATLMSWEARIGWVAPDLNPLPG